MYEANATSGRSVWRRWPRGFFVVAATLVWLSVALFGALALRSLHRDVALSSPPGAGSLQSVVGVNRRQHPTGFFDGWFISRTTGWMVIRHGLTAALARTDDGGAHWRAQLPLVYPKLFQRNMTFLNASTGYVAIAVPTGGRLVSQLLATNDGGQHWLSRSLPPHGNVTGLDFVTDSNGWVLETAETGSSSVSITNDGGATWRDCANLKTVGAPEWSAKQNHLEGLRFADAAQGWIGGWTADGHTLYYYTKDACTTWHATPLIRSQERANDSIWFVDPPQTLGANQSGTVLVEKQNPPAFEISVFSSPSGSNAWRDSSTRLQVQYDLRPGKSGASIPGPGSVGVDFIDPMFGYAEALTNDNRGAILLVTSDGGITWAQRSSLTQ
jgi:photosystem II stability/assembly factor-like uncharacterized protein